MPRTRWACGICGARGTTRIESRLVFHYCASLDLAPDLRPRRRYSPPTRQTREEMRGAIWDGLAAQLDAGWRYRKKKNA